MTIDSFGATQRSIANRQLIRILSIGFCVSSILHIIAIAGISYWSNINIEEELEITTIERVELEPEISPSIEPSTSISKSTSTSSASPIKTAFNTAEKSNSAQFTTTTPKTPQSKPQPPNGLPSATAIVTKKSKSTPPQNSSPTSPKDRSSISSPPIDRSKVTPKTNRSIPDPNNQQLPPELDNNFRSIDNTPPPRRDNIGEQPKNKPRNNTPKNNNQAVSQPGGDNNAPDKQIESGSSSTKKADPNTNLGNNNGGNNSTQKNSASPSLGSNNKSPSDNNGGGSNRNNSGKPNSNQPTGNSNRSVTKCVRNCTIKYPDEFQDSDVGKGKISVRVTIDGNGIVSAAEIVRSSENQQLDSFALEATKKMQFNATGEIRIRRIKVNTITNN
jgi:TonB family protein